MTNAAVQLSLGRRAAFGLVTALALAAATEAGLRAVWRPVKSEPQFLGSDFRGGFPTERDAACIWKFPARTAVPGGDPSESTNSLGFRGPELDNQPGAGRTRICILGDSCAFGLDVYFDETFGSRLQGWLGERFEVVNLGMPGYSAYQALQMLRSRALTLAPAVVVVYAGAWNDYSPAIGQGDAAAHALLGGGARWLDILGGLRLYEFWRGRREGASSRSKEAYREAWEKERKRLDGPRVAPDEFRQYLEAISREARDVGAKVVFVVPPAPASTRARYADSERYAEIVRQVAAGGGVAQAEARAKLDLPAELDAVYFTDVIHPSCLGHARVAEAVTEALLTLGVPGLPAAPLAYSGDFLALKPLQSGARHEAGAPLAEVPASKAAELDSRLLLLPSPHRLTFRGVKIFEGAELRAETGIYDGKEAVKSDGVKSDRAASAPGSAEVEFRVEVVSAGGTRREVLRAAVPRRGLGTWTPLTRQVADLRPFAGETVDLVLTCEGDALYVAWGKPLLHAAALPRR